MRLNDFSACKKVPGVMYSESITVSIIFVYSGRVAFLQQQQKKQLIVSKQKNNRDIYRK